MHNNRPLPNMISTSDGGRPKNASIKSTLSRIGLPSSSTRPDSSVLTYFFDASASQLSHLIPSFIAHSLLPLSSFTLLMFPHRNTICSGVSSSSPHLGHSSSSTRPIFLFHRLQMPCPPRSSAIVCYCLPPPPHLLSSRSSQVLNFCPLLASGLRIPPAYICTLI